MRIIPWMECNVPQLPLSRFYPDVAERYAKGTTMREYCEKGLDYWRHVTDRAIVSTWSNYIEACFSQPFNMVVIGGIKTARELSRGFDDGEGWKRLADCIVRVANLTKVNTVLLDNEAALYSYHRGLTKINYEKLMGALEILNRIGPITILWCMPELQTPDTRFPNRPTATKLLVQAVDDIVDRAVFSTGFTAKADWREDKKGEATRDSEMDHLVGLHRTHKRIYMTLDGTITYGGRTYPTYKPEDVFQSSPLDWEWKAGIGGHASYCVYPTGRLWADVAQKYASLHHKGDLH